MPVRSKYYKEPELRFFFHGRNIDWSELVNQLQIEINKMS